MQSTSSWTSHFGLRAVLRKIWEMIQAQLQVWWAQSPTVSHRWNQHQNTNLCFPSLTILSNMMDNMLIIVTFEHLLYVLCLVAQSCLTLYDTKDCSLPGSSVHGDSPGKNTGVGCHALLQGILPTQGWTQVSRIARKFFTVWTTRVMQKPMLCNILILPLSFAT